MAKPTQTVFNPPPNWPKQKKGWTPPAGWEPDPAWGPPPPNWPLYVQQAPKKHTLRNVLLGLVALTILGVGGCAVLLSAASNSVSNSITKSQQDQKKQDAAIQKDAKIVAGSCMTDSTGFLVAKVAITNSSSQPSTYTATVAFDSADGKTQYDTGNVVIDQLRAGQTNTGTAQTLKESPKGTKVSCRIADVTRLASTP